MTRAFLGVYNKNMSQHSLAFSVAVSLSPKCIQSGKSSPLSSFQSIFTSVATSILVPCTFIPKLPSGYSTRRSHKHPTDSRVIRSISLRARSIWTQVPALSLVCHETWVANSSLSFSFHIYRMGIIQHLLHKVVVKINLPDSHTGPGSW